MDTNMVDRIQLDALNMLSHIANGRVNWLLNNLFTVNDVSA